MKDIQTGRVVETGTTAEDGEQFVSEHLNETGINASSVGEQAKRWGEIQTYTISPL
ncbi:hypothetical protein [Haloarcula nitratireducens]|uniref:hypothetical protein n=1 Tax=Haloarcula nitratireducens TaxID=2487749 RepID=UPI001F2196B7|nr:hypothetical protein [Halomicroarcula nitratireducens]